MPDFLRQAMIPILGSIILPMTLGFAARAKDAGVCGFTVANPPSVFVVGEEKPVLKLLFEHPDQEDFSGGKLQYGISDDRGKVLETGTVPLRMTALGGSAVGVLAPGIRTAGWYKVSLELTDKAGKYVLRNRALPFGDSSFTTFSVVSKPTPGRTYSFFGICEHTMNGEMAKAMRAAGIRQVRTDAMWSDVQGEPGAWNWDRLDDFIDTCQDFGIGVLPIIDYGNRWSNNLGNGERKLPAKEDWITFVKALVTRYKDRVDSWEVWNEANIPNFWLGTQEEYARLLEWTYMTVKSVQPNSTVLFAGTSGADYQWIRGIFTLGGFGNSDAAAMHPYMQPNPPERSLAQAISEERKVEGEFDNGRIKPLWITEMGYHTLGEANPVDELTQARYLARALITAAGSEVKRFFWYEFSDPRVNPGDNESNFGLVYSDLSPKPSYSAYAVLERVMGAEGTTVAKVPYSDSRYRIYGITESDKPRAIAVWTLAKEGTITVKGKSARIVDIFGHYSVLKAEEGRSSLDIPVNQGPTYILGTGTEDVIVPPGLTAPETGVGANLVPNGGFDTGSGKTPSGWVWELVGKPKADFTLVKEAPAGDAREGSRYVRLSYGSPREGNVFGMLSRNIRVKPFTRYKLKAWVRTKDSKCAWIGGGPGWTVRCYLPWDTGGEWKQVEYSFDTWEETSWKLIILIEEFAEQCDIDGVEITEEGWFNGMTAE